MGKKSRHNLQGNSNSWTHKKGPRGPKPPKKPSSSKDPVLKPPKKLGTFKQKKTPVKKRSNTAVFPDLSGIMSFAIKAAFLLLPGLTGAKNAAQDIVTMFSKIDGQCFELLLNPDAFQNVTHTADEIVDVCSFVANEACKLATLNGEHLVCEGSGSQTFDSSAALLRYELKPFWDMKTNHKVSKCIGDVVQGSADLDRYFHCETLETQSTFLMVMSGLMLLSVMVGWYMVYRKHHQSESTGSESNSTTTSEPWNEQELSGSYQN